MTITLNFSPTSIISPFLANLFEFYYIITLTLLSFHINDHLLNKEGNILNISKKDLSENNKSISSSSFCKQVSKSNFFEFFSITIVITLQDDAIIF